MELIREINDNQKIESKQDTKKYLDEFKNEDREFFIVLGLDSNNKVLYRDVVAIGIFNGVLIHPREVFKSAVMRSANSIIIAHNHPSGNIEASEEDKSIYIKLKDAGRILDINVIDCIIITSNSLTSLKGGD